MIVLCPANEKKAGYEYSLFLYRPFYIAKVYPLKWTCKKVCLPTLEITGVDSPNPQLYNFFIKNRSVCHEKLF